MADGAQVDALGSGRPHSSRKNVSIGHVPADKHDIDPGPFDSRAHDGAVAGLRNPSYRKYVSLLCPSRANFSGDTPIPHFDPKDAPMSFSAGLSTGDYEWLEVRQYEMGVSSPVLSTSAVRVRRLMNLNDKSDGSTAFLSRALQIRYWAPPNSLMLLRSNRQIHSTHLWGANRNRFTTVMFYHSKLAVASFGMFRRQRDTTV